MLVDGWHGHLIKLGQEPLVSQTGHPADGPECEIAHPPSGRI